LGSSSTPCGSCLCRTLLTSRAPAHPQKTCSLSAPLRVRPTHLTCLTHRVPGACTQADGGRWEQGRRRQAGTLWDLMWSPRPKIGGRWCDFPRSACPILATQMRTWYLLWRSRCVRRFSSDYDSDRSAACESVPIRELGGRSHWGVSFYL